MRPTEQEISYLLANLYSPDLQDCVAALKVLATDPTGDQRIIAALEPLLVDFRPCVVMIPYAYGELRWLAAHALAAELGAAGSWHSLRLYSAIKPMTASALSLLAERMFGAAATSWPALKKFDRLREVGALETSELVLEPTVGK